MTTPDDHDDEQEMRDYVKHLFGSSEDVRHEYAGEHIGLTREELLRQNANTGWAEVTLPGEVILDADGNPNGVGESHTKKVFRQTVVLKSDLVRLNLTPDDVPNVIVMDDPEERNQP